jgi:Ca-activated chloride channel family protein
MTFAWPLVLWLLLAPAALLARELARRYRANAESHPNILRAEAGTRTLALKPFRPDGASGRRSRLWLAAGLALAVAALARPQWGRIDEPMFNQSREILIAVDLSRSMLATDVKPSRLERAKLLAQSLIDKLAGERVGLIAFAGTAFLQSPLSSDYQILNEFLPQLSPDFMPVGGTNYGALMDTAAAAFSDAPATDRFLIVLSDGGATDDDWRNHIGALKKKGIRVIGLGVGTGAGGLIPDGAGGFMKDADGAVVLSRLESANLRELAQKTDGVYRDAGSWLDLGDLLKATVETGRKGHFLDRKAVRRVERYQWFLAPALLCLLISFLREFPVRPTPRDLKLSTGDGGSAGISIAAGLIAILLPLAPILWPSRASAAAEGGAPPPDSALLGRIVGRLAAQDASSPLDWAELARETVTWGEHLRAGKESVPPGPVRDALAAVDAGSALDSKAADWPGLRSRLEELLHPPKEQKPPPPPQKQSQQNQQNPQSKQDQKQQQQPQQKQSERQGQPQSQQEQQQKQQQQTKNQSPQQPGETQKVGGGTDRRDETLARTNPELAPSLEKLEQLRGQDSPAELWQKIQQNQPRPPSDKPEKDW